MSGKKPSMSGTRHSKKNDPLEAADTEDRPLFELKTSICGPPTTPTLSVPVTPDTDMSTPFSEPAALKGMVPGPTADCLWAKAVDEQAAAAAASHARSLMNFKAWSPGRNVD